MLRPIILPIALVLTATASGQNTLPVFQKVTTTLENLSSLQYDSYREINNYEDNYFAKNRGSVYIEFDNSKVGKVSRCQLRSDAMLQVYNGSEFFSLYEKDKTYEGGRSKPTALSNTSLFYNSIATLRLSLPSITRDATIHKSVKDTAVDGKTYHLLKFELYKKTLEFPSGFSSFDAEVTRFYSLLIDRETNLPYMIIDRNSIMKDRYYTKTIFTNIKTAPSAPGSDSWFISDYKEYSLKKQEEQKPLIAVGTQLPEWALPQIGSNDSITLSGLKGKKIVMEFWIKNCGYCMAAFPGVKELQHQYGDNTNVVSINSYEEKKDVEFFYNREKPAYRMLYGGEKLANSIGVYAYPAVVIADGNGKVIYSGRGFDKKEIEQVLGK